MSLRSRQRSIVMLVAHVVVLLVPVPYRRGEGLWSWKWQVLARISHQRRHLWLDVTRMGASASTILASNKGLSLWLGHIGIRKPIPRYFGDIPSSVRFWTIVVFLEPQYERRLYYIDSDSLAIKISLSTYFSYAMWHRSIFSQSLGVFCRWSIRRFRKVHNGTARLRKNIIRDVCLEQIVNSFTVRSDRRFLWSHL